VSYGRRQQPDHVGRTGEGRSAMEGWQTYLKANEERSIAELQRLVRQRSVSSQNDGIRECAALVAAMLRERGFATEVWETPGHPVIFAEMAGTSERSLLFYNHYDVQPPEPLEEWRHPPFGAEIHDGVMHGRGTGDHKSSFVARLMAIEALLEQGPLPVGIKFVVEGEEEIGSPNLAAVVAANAERLRADAGLYSGGAMDEHDRPVIRAGSKGMCYVELRVRTVNTDLHSRWAAVIPSPVWRLVEALHCIKDPASDRILIGGFYDDVEPATEEELAEIGKFPLDDAFVREDLGASRLLGNVTGVDASHRSMFSPTCNVSGLTAGYQGPGMKSVLPAVASAKVDMRLVPWQDAHDVHAKLRAHLDAHGFQDVETTLLGTINPGKAKLSEPIIVTLREAARRAYPGEPVIQPITPGSGPRYIFADHLGLHIVSDAGCSYHGAGHHSPKENIRVIDYLRNAEHIGWLITLFGQES
jgi:acetylornithine deacetylase/succinyl-diaminopimelate desuccinylase-like protein